VRYRFAMTAASRSGPAEKLAALLESATPEVRREIIAWLLSGPAPLPATAGVPWLPPSSDLGHTGHHGTAHPAHLPSAEAVAQLRQLAGSLPAGADNQVVTLRLPAERHAALRQWCAAHGFSMAAVVRGLVERFLEGQARSV
jgi:hypothetical protein